MNLNRQALLATLWESIGSWAIVSIVSVAVTLSSVRADADDAQKAQLMSGFEALLIKTYAGALSQAADARVKLRPSIAIDSTTREVRSEVALRSGGDPVALSYRLSLQGDDWKVTDVSVMGVWLVPTYRSQFAQVLQTSGVDGLIQVLAAKTRAH
jgi:phospholipid transport system substrate-binding protein